MSKPNWVTAPDWARWLGQDIDGSWWWYLVKPFADAEGFFEPCAMTRYRPAGNGERNAEWQETLEHRPDSQEKH